MYSFIKLAAILATTATTFTAVSAHGIIKDFTVNGKTFPGTGSDSVVRPVQDGNPVLDVNSAEMTCGRNAKNAPASAPVNAGDKVEISWKAEGGGNWFHNTGPVITYMAKCDGDCKDYTADKSTKWFKIDALGRKDGSESWFQADMLDGSPLPATIPANLASGNYLLRHEVIALQNAASKDLAEFYPGCVQLKVTGNKVQANADISPEVAFPGAYKDTDAGIMVDVYTPPFDYKMPGPAVANIVGGSSSGGDNNSNDDGDSTPSTPSSSAPSNAAPTPTDSGDNSDSDSKPSKPASSSAAAPSSTGKCKLRKRSSSSNNNSTRSVQKRALRAHAKRRMAAASY